MTYKPAVVIRAASVATLAAVEAFSNVLISLQSSSPDISCLGFDCPPGSESPKDGKNGKVEVCLLPDQ